MKLEGPEVLPESAAAPQTGAEYPLPETIFDAHNHPRKESDGSEIIELMDAHHIERNVILGTPSAGTTSNARVLEWVRKYPGRFVGGVFADPREGDAAIEEIRRYNGEGLKIVKLFPNYGYFPDDPAVRPFFEAVAELKMAVLSHCGWLAPKPGSETAAYYSHPGRFEKLVRVFPETIFIMAHMGGIAGFLETVMLTTRTPNTFVDCSPGQGLWALEAAGPMVATVPPDRLLWGCDSYNYEGLIPRYKAALEAIGFGPHFQAIWHDNADGLFRKIGAIE